MDPRTAKALLSTYWATGEVEQLDNLSGVPVHERGRVVEALLALSWQARTVAHRLSD
jgi:hypothetical protein